MKHSKLLDGKLVLSINGCQSNKLMPAFAVFYVSSEFIYSLNNCLLNVSYIPGNLLDTK